jgi:hypothetical protein
MRETVRPMGTFGTILIVVAVIAVIAAAASYWGSAGLYREIGRPRELAPQPGPAADVSLRDEVRQLVIARNERLLRQGREPLDVEAEVDRQLRDLGA